MKILDTLSWWLAPRWVREEARAYNALVETAIVEGKKLQEFCEMMDAAIGDTENYVIFGNYPFVEDYRDVFGVNAHHMTYDGHKIFLKDQEEYFKIVEDSK